MPQTINPVQKRSLRTVFFNRDGLRSGWRFLLYVVLFAGFARLLSRAENHVPSLLALRHSVRDGGAMTPAASYLLEASVIASMFLAAAIMSRIEKKRFDDYGTPFRLAFGKWFWIGILAGLIFQSAEMLIIHAFGGFSFGAVLLSGATLVEFAIAWAVAFVMVGISEEFLFRGYAQSTLASGIGFWPAALLLSAAFGAIHLGNPGEGWVGALDVFAFALFACLTLRRTGNLWFAIGFHAASDYGETFLFGVPDSGLKATHVLINSSLHGPAWLTGGTVGPEGSVFDFILLAVSAALFVMFVPTRPALTRSPLAVKPLPTGAMIK